MVGRKLSHYKILDELGRGGMGIVYKAEDTKLDRIVAIKVLPPAALASEDDRARFYREAKAAAALHHPNIASVFEIDEAAPEGGPADDKRPFIAMEFIDGGTLHERVEGRPLKISEARDIAVQVASALELAHSKDIVHRDVKSGNIMVDATGTAKILDFGLAQTAQSTKLTQMGSTVGTIAYMSPEQARGEAVDLRTDLWSLGVVLYEMISGRYPFPGDYEQAVVYSILNNDPEPLTAVRTGVPMQLEWIVNKLLAKDAADRYQSAKDLIVDLKHVDVTNPGLSQISMSAARPVQTTTPRSSIRGRRTWLVLVSGLLLGTLGASAGFLLSWPESADQGLARVELSLPAIRSVAFPTMSPDGKYLAFLGTDVQQRDGVFLRDIATGELRYIEGSSVAGDREMGFSPNGERIAFNAGFNGGLYVSVVPSGIPERITEYGRFAVWEDNRTIVMTDDKPGGGESYRVDVLTREVEQLEVKDSQLEEGKGNVIKTMIPGSQRFFGHQITRLEGGNVGEVSNLFTLNARSGKVDVIERNAINPLYIAGGFLLYQVGDDDGRLVVRPIDTRTGQFTGPPRDALPSGQSVPWSLYSITSKGDLLHIPDADGLFSGSTNVLWFVDASNESSREIRTNLPAGFQPLFPSLSPDGNLVSFVSDNGQSGNLFVYDVSDDVVYQYTFSGRHGGGSFSSDSKYIYYTKQVGDDRPAVYRTSVGSSEQEEFIAEDVFLPTIAGEDSYVLATGLPPTYRFELLKITVSSLAVSEFGRDSNGDDPVVGMRADVSPDGRYITFQSTANLAFTATELFVISADGRQKVQIPGVEGFNPVWSGDGRYIYYATYGNIFRLPVRTNPTFNILGEPEWVLTAAAINGFDLGSDNNTLVVSASRIAFDQIAGDADRVVWFQNWSAHLKRQFGR